MRVIKGGHDVPEEAIRRRFQRSLDNFWLNFRTLTDEWMLLFNGVNGNQSIAFGEKNNFFIENQVQFDLFKFLRNE